MNSRTDLGPDFSADFGLLPEPGNQPVRENADFFFWGRLDGAEAALPFFHGIKNDVVLSTKFDVPRLTRLHVDILGLAGCL